MLYYKRIGLFLGIAGTRGFYRGMLEYDYEHCIRQADKNPPTYLYSSRMMRGLLGAFFYMNPAIYVAIIPDELYRIEVDIRGLEEEKKTRRYNCL
jgi:hypothetical protein